MTKVSQLTQASGEHMNFPVAGCSPRHNFYNNGATSLTVTAAVGPQSMVEQTAFHPQLGNDMLPFKKSKRATRSPQNEGLVMQDRSNTVGLVN